MPQSTRVAGSRPVKRASSGRSGPSVAQAGVIGGISRCQPWRATIAAGRRSAAHQRCDWAAALVTSSARTPESRQAQYCGVGRKARAAARASGQSRSNQRSWRAAWAAPSMMPLLPRSRTPSASAR